MKTKLFAKALPVALITFLVSSSKAQTIKEPEWKPILSANTSIAYLDTANNKVLITLNSKSTTPKIDDKLYTQPFVRFNLKTGKLDNLKSNWVGNAINFTETVKISNDGYMLNNADKVIYAKIVGDSIIYKSVTDILPSNWKDVKVCVGKKNVYYSKFNSLEKDYYGEYIYICDTIGNFQKKVLIREHIDINYITEFKGELIVGYKGNYPFHDGIGVARVNLTTGDVIKIGTPEIYNFDGCIVKTIQDRLFICALADKYRTYVIFENINGNWVALQNYQGLPIEINGKIYLSVPDKKFGQRYFYPTNDTIESDEAGYRELPKDLSLGLGEFLDPTNHAFDPFKKDPLCSVSFDQDFINSFTVKNGFNPIVDYVYTYHIGEFDSVIYGIGDGVIAYLGEKTNEVKTSKVDLPKISIYPNPANETINIQNLAKDVEYIVTNAIGQNVLTGITMGKINITNLTPGFYYISISGYKPEKLLKR